MKGKGMDYSRMTCISNGYCTDSEVVLFLLELAGSHYALNVPPQIYAQINISLAKSSQEFQRKTASSKRMIISGLETVRLLQNVYSQYSK